MVIFGLLALLWLLPLAAAAIWLGAAGRVTGPSSNGLPASAWANDTRTQTPAYNFTLPSTSQAPAVDPSFASYYTTHGGPQALGLPLTVAYQSASGRVQFFAAGALFVPTAKVASVSTATPASPWPFGDLTQLMYNDGITDPASGIVRISLLHALLTVGSLTPLSGSLSDVGDATGPTYADLRHAILPIQLAKTTATATTIATTPTADTDEPTFVYQQGATKHTSNQLISQPMWQYLTRPDVSSAGWQTDFGLPLTLPISLAIVRDGTPHHLLVQAFWRGALLQDNDDPDDHGQPTVIPLTTGLAYLQTLGAPAPQATLGTRVWATGDLALTGAPQVVLPLAHVGQNFPLTLSGKTAWIGNDLWYAVQWTNPHSTYNGWAPASALTTTAPGANATAWAQFDALSPDLANYLKGIGSNVGVAVYDLTRHQYYGYNMNGQFTTGSSIKVAIMLATLQMTESQHRQPNANEMYLLTTMIEESDNDSAQALFVEIGGAPALSRLMSGLGIPGLNPAPDAWGYSTIAPLAMVRLLTALHNGNVLTAQDNKLAINLMSSVEPGQQWGVGDTAPPGASFQMKDGWVPGPDGLWAMNSSGIVTVGNETYIIAVYRQHLGGYDWSPTEHICGAVAKLLT
jgi:beta-lactamase class A